MKKARILHVTTHLDPGGITTYVYLLAKSMNRGSCETSVLSSGGRIARRFEEMGIKTFELPYRTKSVLSPVIYSQLPRFIELVKRERIDLIHAHTRVAQVMSWRVQKATGVSYISTCHGFYRNRLGRRLFPAWGKHTIAVSDAVKAHLIHQFHLPANRVTTILGGVDMEDLETKISRHNASAILREWNLRSTTPVVGIIARLVEEKGHEYLVRALAELRTLYPDIKLLIVGDGSFKKSIQELVRQLNLSESIVFTGDLEDVTKALRVIDIFVMPVTWRESFGFSIIEAMAFSKPVVVTNTWALSSLIQNRVNALLIEPCSVPAIANAIAELIEKKELRGQIGSNAREIVVKEFSLDQMADKVEELYSKVLWDNKKR